MTGLACLSMIILLVIALVFRRVRPRPREHEHCAERSGLSQITFESSYENLENEEKRQYQIGPKFTETGILGLKLPLSIKAALRTAWLYRTSVTEIAEEEVDFLYTKTQSVPSIYYDVQLIDPVATSTLVEFLKNKLAQWTSVSDLQLTSVYGFREYKPGAVLKMHVDKFQTHALSAIVNVRKENTPWPLVAYDHHRRQHAVYFDDFDVLLYESGTVIHGRPIPYTGSSFVNVFVHFTCSDWKEKVAKPMEAEGY